jgi:2-polyprenyl-6-methoxyphenol hydroxylase-like FAD-dependent oxidoreductase
MLNTIKSKHLLFRFISKLTNGNKYMKISKLSTNMSTNNEMNDKQNQNNSQINGQIYDIVINGGGIVGFSLLSALKSSPFLKDKRIILIEQQSEPKEESKQLSSELSNRVSSITTSSKEFFEQIGVWNDLKDFAKPIKQMYVWSQRFRNGINFRPTLDDNQVVCYVIENYRILSALHSKVNHSDHSVCYGTVVTDIKSDANCVKVNTKCNKNDYLNSFKTRLLIGCDGLNSIVRQKSNLDNFEHDLEQIAIVGTIAVSSGDANDSNDISFQRFVPSDNSVIALLPLTRDYCSFVVSVSKELANRLMQMSEQQFVDYLNDTLFSEPIPSSTSITNKLDEIIDSLVPKQFFAEQAPNFSVPNLLSLVPNSRAAFPLKFSTTVPFLVGTPNDCKDNNKIVIIGLLSIFIDMIRFNESINIENSYFFVILKAMPHIVSIHWPVRV